MKAAKDAGGEPECKLRENAGFITDVLNSLTARIVVLDAEGRIVAGNEAWRRFADEDRNCDLGLPTSTELGAVYFLLRHPGSSRKSAEAVAAYDGLQAVLDGAQDHFEMEYPCQRDGVKRWFLLTISPLKTGKGATVSHVDITDHKRAEDRIAEQAAFLDNARDAIIACSLDGRILFWNRGAELLYGWKPEEVMELPIDTVLSGDPKMLERSDEEVMAKGEWSGEIRSVAKSGKEIIVQSRWTLMRDHEGRPKSVLGINTDITEKKKIEGHFLRAQRMESIGTLAGGVAHDLNNILAPIMMSIEVLKDMVKSPQAQGLLDTIAISAQRGADIVRQVLSFARGVEGKRVEIQLKHLVEDLEQIIKNTFPKNIRLRFVAPADTWTILGDPTQVHQVLLNLCLNARDAMPNGGSLTVHVENCELDEQYATMNLEAKPGHYVKIGVADTGTGIDPETLDKIFEPFFTTKDIQKGTGLGLSTALAIIKSHEGMINVYSEVGKGTIFQVYFRALRDSRAAGMEEDEEQLPQGNGETVLLIDDEPTIIAITRQTLQAFGYQALAAMDGAEAIALYAQHRDEIAVVLTDMRMPVLDGAATIRALMRINPAVKIIAASGLDVNGGVAKLSGAGVKQFLTKPYTAGVLLRALRRVLDEC